MFCTFIVINRTEWSILCWCAVEKLLTPWLTEKNSSGIYWTTFVVCRSWQCWLSLLIIGRVWVFPHRDKQVQGWHGQQVQPRHRVSMCLRHPNCQLAAPEQCAPLSCCQVLDCNIGCYVRHMSVSVFMYTDDIILLCPSVDGLQRLLRVCPISRIIPCYCTVTTDREISGIFSAVRDFSQNRGNVREKILLGIIAQKLSQKLPQ